MKDRVLESLAIFVLGGLGGLWILHAWGKLDVEHILVCLAFTSFVPLVSLVCRVDRDRGRL